MNHYAPFPEVNVTLYIEKEKTTLLPEKVATNVDVDVNVDIQYMVIVKPNEFLSRQIVSQEVRK